MLKLLSIAILLTAISCKNKPYGDTTLVGMPMPSFNILTLDSSKISTGDIPDGTPIVFMYFSPACQYCRAMTKELTEEIDKFKKVNIYMLSNASLESLKEYREIFKLQKYSNVSMVQDPDGFAINYYKIIGVPYIAIYDKEKKLKSGKNGKISIDNLKESLAID